MEATSSFRANPTLAELVTTLTQLLGASAIVSTAHVKGHSCHPWNDMADRAAAGALPDLQDIHWPACLTRFT
eukprot:6760513-Lingulodinium_polyedra.AAC.1